jgi:hypothetical protein
MFEPKVNFCSKWVLNAFFLYFLRITFFLKGEGVFLLQNTRELDGNISFLDQLQITSKSVKYIWLKYQLQICNYE